MSRNALILQKSETPGGPVSGPIAGPVPPPRSTEFVELARKLFRNRSVVAVVGAGSGSRSDEACHGIAAELAAGGHRVVIVQVEAALQAHILPPATAARPWKVPNVWLWPPLAEPSVEFFPSQQSQAPELDWLSPLRREFDAVLLDCAACDSAPNIAAMADATVLTIESGVTEKQQILRDQRTLELRGAKLVGCILMQRK